MEALSVDPLVEIKAERDHARQLGDPNADVCYLATVTAEGQPEVRAISLRDISPKGFELLLNVTSPKWNQLSTIGRISLLIHWSMVKRQYRIRGRVCPMEPEKVAQYWVRKSYGSQLLEQYYTVFHPQSHPIPSRAHLLQGIQELKRCYPEKDGMPMPKSLVGVYLFPHEVETWYGSPEDRLHDRRLFRRSDAGWSFQTLVP